MAASVVWGISFYNELCVWNPMCKDRSRGEGLFQGVECFFTFVIKIPRSVFSYKMSERNNYVWIVENEMSVEVGKS